MINQCASARRCKRVAAGVFFLITLSLTNNGDGPLASATENSGTSTFPASHPSFGNKRVVGGASVAATSATDDSKRLTMETINPNLKKMEYAVRGTVVIAADKINEELSSSEEKASKYNFDKILYTNIGNPHSLGQSPLTWPRQVMALVDLPDEQGVDHKLASEMFPADAIERAKEIKIGLKGQGSGAYSHSKGVFCFRKDVADFIQKRDGYPSNPEHIFLTNGASSGIMSIMTALIANEHCGAMIPIPQYPIYSATIDLLGGHQVGYYLDENRGWDLNREELERSLEKAKQDGIAVTCFVLINPGNPTGQVLSKDTVKEVVRFCSDHNLVLLADEVYQENVYDENSEFYSCKKAAAELGLIEEDAIELVSFHSTSKGVFGECGRRGGYMELVGIDEDVFDQIYKLASAKLCSNLDGQIMTSIMVRGPPEGSESHKSHLEERMKIFDSLRRRSQIVSEGLNNIPGFSCQKAMGAMYGFPSIELPAGAIDAAKARGIAPDTLYCVDLLERTGICVVPASGFGQKHGRFGFRTTILPPENEMVQAVEAIAKHYEAFCSEYTK